MIENKPCSDCGAAVGTIHSFGCFRERCPKCGLQAIGCDCFGSVKNSERMPWTGQWPGDAECREFGWYAKFVDGQWVPCEKDDPCATEDLNRLYAQAVWNPEAKRWVLPSAVTAICDLCRKEIVAEAGTTSSLLGHLCNTYPPTTLIACTECLHGLQRNGLLLGNVSEEETETDE